jgi:predicted RNA binding protein YcfA (HicA-like mRNA interferase family)
MSKFDKLIVKLLSGNSDSNFEFSDLVNLLDKFEFKVRIKGSHHIFYKENIDEILNLQPNDGKAKTYQVKQVRDVLIKYKLIKQ